VTTISSRKRPAHVREPVRLRNDRSAQRTFQLMRLRFPVRCECGSGRCERTFIVTLEEYAEARRNGRALTAHSRA